MAETDPYSPKARLACLKLSVCPEVLGKAAAAGGGGELCPLSAMLLGTGKGFRGASEAGTCSTGEREVDGSSVLEIAQGWSIVQEYC